MASKMIIFAVIMAAASAVPQGYHFNPAYGNARAGPVYARSVEVQEPIEVEQNSNPEYSFSYEVNDEQTGDIKSHQETRRGDVVEGRYSLVEPDGTRRIVEYKADDISGFNAVVSKEGTPQIPAVTDKYQTSSVSAPQETFNYASAPATGQANYDGASYVYRH